MSPFSKPILPIVCAASAAAIAALSASGWLFGIAHLTSVFAGLPRLVPLTALLAGLAYLALWLQAGAAGTGRPDAAPAAGVAARVTAEVAAAGVLCMALGVVACHAAGRAPQPFVFGGGHQVSPFSLPSAVTAAMFLAAAASLLGLARAATIRHGQWLALGLLLLALLTLAGYPFRDTFLYALLPGKGTSILTTLVFILLAIGLLALRPREGIMVAVAGPAPGAWVARRLLLSALAMPVLLGVAAALALRVDLIDVGTAIAFLVWGMIALFTASVWRFALVLYRIDTARRAAEHEREAALDRLREADAHKDDFMALLAHELRNPLAPIRAAADLLPKVFDAFSQATRTAGRADGGLGLGLALVRRLAELHDGTVTAHSAGPGQGSTFVLALPRLPDAEADVSRGGRPG